MTFKRSPRGISYSARTAFFLTLILTTAMLLFTQGAAHSRTWYVKADGTGDAPTIQAGVDSAAVGDTVLVGVGTYADTTHVFVTGTPQSVNVHIRKCITLIGDPSGSRPLIDGVNGYLGIFVENVDSTVSIVYLSLRGTAFSEVTNAEPLAATAPVTREYSARIRCHSSSVEVKDVIISNDHDGVFLSNSTADVHGSELHTVSMAILCFDGSDATIHNNSIFNCAVGIECDQSSAHVSNNTIGAPEPAGQGVGISCSSSSVDVTGNAIRWCGTSLTAIGSVVTIDGNEFSNHHENGARLLSSSAIITNNIFYNGEYAVWASSGTTGEISNNTIDGWDTGILCELGGDQVIRRNIISRGFWGIQCMSSALTVECNDVFDMSSGLYYWSCVGQPGEGNFSADPEYCGIDDSGNYFLQSDSPCTPGNHPLGNECGLVGALPVNCGKVETKRTTWGSIKSSFKDGGER